MNPRGRKHEKPGGPRFRIGSPLIYLGLVLLGLLLFRNMFQEVGYVRVPYSEFKQAIQDGRFKRVQITPDSLRGFTTDVIGVPARSNDQATAPWMASRVEDPELLHLLESKKVQFEAVPGSGLNEAVWIWGLPLLLGLVFWTWMMRRMGAGGLGQGPQSVMSFGKT
ncbi:MAG TPA: ATP-dependent metallopeptidase FtsH/Yme1/Tma family protein, partial [Myxococcaceae bacterium]|nr:ATP-dependent metallopeptidase FtsH/Yme1/Tma family protein [Myxococcaceae bacterium]